MDDKNQNSIEHGLNAAEAHAADSQQHQQVEELSSQLQNYKGTSASVSEDSVITNAELGESGADATAHMPHAGAGEAGPTSETVPVSEATLETAVDAVGGIIAGIRESFGNDADDIHSETR